MSGVDAADVQDAQEGFANLVVGCRSAGGDTQLERTFGEPVGLEKLCASRIEFGLVADRAGIHIDAVGILDVIRARVLPAKVSEVIRVRRVVAADDEQQDGRHQDGGAVAQRPTDQSVDHGWLLVGVTVGRDRRGH